MVEIVRVPLPPSPVTPLPLTPVRDPGEGVDPVDHVGHVLLVQLAGRSIAVEVKDIEAVWMGKNSIRGVGNELKLKAL